MELLCGCTCYLDVCKQRSVAAWNRQYLLDVNSIQGLMHTESGNGLDCSSGILDRHRLVRVTTSSLDESGSLRAIQN